MTATPPGRPVSDPDVAATVRLLHRRQGWGRAAVTSFIAFLLASGASSSAQSQGTPPPTRHRVTWALRWVGMLLILVVAVVGVPAVFDGVAYLAGDGKMVVFDPVSHQTDCDQYGCTTSTSGIMETGGAGVEATWPHVVPLGRSFRVREPVWNWGLGGALIDSDGIAVGAVLISLLIEGAAVLAVVRIIQLAGNWRRHQQQTAPAPFAVP